MRGTTVPLGDVLLIAEDFRREPSEEGSELVTIDMRLESRGGALGDISRPPTLELRDNSGAAYDIAFPNGWTEEMQPGGSITAHPQFQVPVDAMGLDLVVAPGTEDETHIELLHRRAANATGYCNREAAPATFDGTHRSEVRAMATIPESHRDLLTNKNFAHVATLMPDGSPQVTPVWVDLEGDLVVFNSAEGRQKVRNLDRDGRVAISVHDQANPYRYIQIRGTVAERTTKGADEQIDRLAKKYLNQDTYPYRNPAEQRVIFKVRPDHVQTYA